MYRWGRRKYKSREEFLRKEFNFSNQEICKLDKFIIEHNPKSIKEFLDEIIEDPSLDNKERVAISYMMGNFMKDDICMNSIHNSILESIVFANDKKEEGE